jgi:hypothetical protein
MFDVLPFGAGASLCPPDYEPPCTCPPDGIDAACPVDGDGVDHSDLRFVAGGESDAVEPGSGSFPHCPGLGSTEHQT